MLDSIPLMQVYSCSMLLESLMWIWHEGTELQLLSCVKEEVELEQSQSEELPAVTGFTATISGCQATLRKECDSEKSVYVPMNMGVYCDFCLQNDSSSGHTPCNRGHA